MKNSDTFISFHSLHLLLNTIMFCFLCITCHGQATPSENRSTAPINYKLDFLISSTGYTSVTTSFPAQSIDKFNYAHAYEKSLGIFCKAENKASKKAAIQMRCRLGSLEYVDRLEGKIR